VDSVKPQLEQEQQQQVSTVVSKDYTFQATQYISQVVAGTIYFVKIRTIQKQHTPQDDDDDATWWHVKIFQPLPYTREPPQVIGIQHCKMDDPLVAF
jgi:hypothetical protein